MWNEKRLQQLKADGNIRGYTPPLKKDKVYKSATQQQRNNIPHAGLKNIPRPSPEKTWLSWNLLYWGNDKALELKTEYQFDEKRKWQFDWCYPAVKIAIEYEGIFTRDKSRTGHTSITGVMRDVEKYNAAMLQGWKIVRVTAANYKTVFRMIEKLL
jgi:hypothetical protein